MLDLLSRSHFLCKRSTFGPLFIISPSLLGPTYDVVQLNIRPSLLGPIWSPFIYNVIQLRKILLSAGPPE